MVSAHEAAGRGLRPDPARATTPPTPATSRSASGWPTQLGRPVVNGIKTVEVADGVATCAGRRPGRRGGDLPGAAAGGGHRAGGRRRAALPDDHRPDEGQEGQDRDGASRVRRPDGPRRVRLTLPPAQPSTVEVLGEGPAAAPAVVDLLQQPGGGPMILVFVETDGVGRGRGVAGDGHVRPRPGHPGVRRAGRRADPRRGRRRRCRTALSISSARTACSEVHHAVGEAFSAYGGAAWAARRARRWPAATGAVAVTASGSPRGNEILAHLAARLDVAMAANVVGCARDDPVPGDPAGGRRGGAGGDAARRPAGGVQRGRARRRGRRRRASPATPDACTSSPRRWPRPTWWRGWCPPSPARRTSRAACARPGSWSAPGAGPAARTASTR